MTNSATIALTTIRPLTEADIEAVHGLSVEVGWPHRADDWRLVLELGHGVVACDDAGRVMGSAMWWPFGEELATIGMVIVSPRMQARGTGRRVMREIFSAAGTRALRLVATAAGQRLYESEGFRATRMIAQYQGVADAAAAVADSRVREAQEADWPVIAALDAEAYGGDRSRMLAALRRVGRTFVLEEGAGSPASRSAGPSAAATSSARSSRPMPGRRSRWRARTCAPMRGASCASTPRSATVRSSPSRRPAA